MNEISNTKITIIVLSCFIAGVVLGTNYPNYYLFLVIPLILSIFFFLSDFKYRILVLISILLLCFGFAYSIYRYPEIPKTDISKFAPLKNVSLIGRITSDPKIKTFNSMAFNLSVNTLVVDSKDFTVTGNIIVNAKEQSSMADNLKMGYKVKCTGNLSIPKTASNPGEFDYNKYLLNDGITAKMYAKEGNIQILNQPESLIYKFLNYISYTKDYIYEVHKNALTVKQAQLLGGIVLGDKAIPVDKDLKQNFIRAGLAHILAASGLNVALLALAWIFVTSKIKLPFNVQIIGGMIIVIIYSFLAGLPPSVLRSAFMLELIFIGKLINKDADLLALIILVASLLLLYDPYMFNDISFQLSFLTALGLIISIPIIQEYIVTIPQWIAMLIVVPMVAQIWVSPVIIYHFHNFSTYSIASNFLAMPLVAIITYLGFVSSALSIIPIIGIPVATSIDKITSPVINVLIGISEYFATLPYSFSHFSFSSIFELIIFYVIMGIFLYFMFKKYSASSYLIFISSLIAIFLCINLFIKNPEQLKITFFDVGDADSILIETPEGKHILIDGGYRFGESFNSADWVIKPYLYMNRINSLDSIILTHPQNDHIGGILEIIEEFPVGTFYDTALSSKNKTYKKLLADIIIKRIPYKILREKDIIDTGDGIRIMTLSPREKWLSKRNMNRSSLLAKLVYKDFSVLLTGDTESDILSKINPKKYGAKILKVGHHGSKISLNEAVLKNIHPELAIISAGKTKYHPATNTIKLLKAFKIKTLVTKETGAIEITTNGNTYNVKTYKSQDFQE